MTIAYVKNSNGEGAIVENTFRTADGVLHSGLGEYFTDSGGWPYRIFWTELPTIPVPPTEPETPGTTGPTEIFFATDIDIFIATDNETFIA